MPNLAADTPELRRPLQIPGCVCYLGKWMFFSEFQENYKYTLWGKK
jgi:hypothetical protein